MLIKNYNIFFQLAEANNMFFSETSAKDNVNVENVFMKLLDQVVEKVRKT